MRTLRDIFLLLTIAIMAQSQGIAQELPISSANPIPEEALKEAPSFGGSRPADSPQVLPADEKSKPLSDTTTAEWKPKLMVKLRIQQPGTAQVETIRFPRPDASPFQPASIASTNERNFAILKSDDVQVEVTTDEKGTPVYSFTCKGKAILSVSGNTITADSITTVDGKLSATNAVIEMPNKTFICSDKLTLELTIFEIEVKSAEEEVQKQKMAAESAPEFLNGDEPFGIEP